MPEPKPPEPKPNPSPAAPAKPNRLAAPAQAELKQSEAKITQKYGAEIAAARTDPGEKRKLAKTLYLDFLQEGNDSALRYASLEKSFEMAVELGELEKLVLPLLEEFQETFEVDTDLLAAGAFDRLLAQPEWHGEQASVIQKASSEQWPKALRSHHYAAAIKLSELSVRAARLAMSKEAAALDRRAKELSQFIGVLELWDQAAEKGSKKLQLVSDDPTAHYQVGVMECLGKENWEEGLPHLAKGSDAELKSPASKELAMPAAPADQLALAQSWIEIARQKRGLAALHLFKHARAWIEKAMQGSGVPREMAAAMQQEADTQIVRLSKTLDDLTANVAAP